jgi:hypothetical protein
MGATHCIHRNRRQLDLFGRYGGCGLDGDYLAVTIPAIGAAILKIMLES